MLEEGHPTQAPCMRIWTTPSLVMSTNSMSPPSDWTAGRMRSMTARTLSWRVSGALACMGDCVLAGGLNQAGRLDSGHDKDECVRGVVCGWAVGARGL